MKLIFLIKLSTVGRSLCSDLFYRHETDLKTLFPVSQVRFLPSAGFHWPQVQQEDGRLQQGHIIHLSGRPHMFLICLFILHVFMLFVVRRRPEKTKEELYLLHTLSTTCQQEGVCPFCPLYSRVGETGKFG